MSEWEKAIEATYKEGIYDCESGISYCFNPYNHDVNDDRKNAWNKGFSEAMIAYGIYRVKT